MSEIINDKSTDFGEARVDAVNRDAVQSGTTAQMAVAARWLAANLDIASQPFTKVVRETYGLGFVDAVKAIAEARRVRAGSAI